MKYLAHYIHDKNSSSCYITINPPFGSIPPGTHKDVELRVELTSVPQYCLGTESTAEIRETTNLIVVGGVAYQITVVGKLKIS